MQPSFVIRPARAEDAAEIAEIYRPIVEDTAISFELEAPGADEMARRIESLQQTHLWLVCEHQGRVVAYAYGGTHRARKAYQWATEVSVYVAEEFRKKRLAWALYSVLLKGLELQGYVLALAGITIPNPQSEAFHRARGFELFANYKNIGFKLGQWHNVSWFRKELRDTATAPVVIQHYSKITENQEWENILKQVQQIINI